ncbi:MAG: hypothetical protein IKU15_07395 [Clostridia bacterium]|nr:hypothetical protein [Clostridia bacterium]
MAIKNYTTKTASLKATTADIRKVEAKQLEAGSVQADALTVKKGEEYVPVTELIQDAADNAAIAVGRDADKNWSVDETAIGMVKKLSFLGDYVNVVEGEDGEVKLYIGENKSLPEANKTAIDGIPSTTKSVLLYADDTDTFTLPVTANSGSQAAITVADGSNFTASTLTAKDANGTQGCFTLDSGDFIWVRYTYEGTTSAWGKVSLKKNRGTYTRNDANPTASSVSKVGFSADSTFGEAALPAGVTMSIGNYVLTAEDDAKNGKVPGRCETQFSIGIDWNTILTKDGGTVKFDWAIGASEPTSPNTFSRFFTEYKSVAMSSVAATVSKGVMSAKVSGLEYLTKDTEVTVTTSDITNSQYKSAESTKRLNVNAAGTSVDFTNAELTLVSGTITKSDAVYKLDGSSSKSNVIKLGTTGTGSAAVKATPYGYAAGTERSATSIANFWGSIPTSDSKTEKFGVETTYRMAKVDSTEGSYNNTKAVDDKDMLASIPTTSYTNLVQAVCQYGKLKHPKNAAADGHGETPYSGITSDAVFIRKFQATSDQKLVLSGTNIGKAKAVYWYDGATYNLISTAKTGVYEVANDKLTVTWSSSLHQPISTSGRNIMIIIVMSSSNSEIGALTLS